MRVTDSISILIRSAEPVLLVCLLLSSVSVIAQAPGGSITGIVTESAGAPVAGVHVSLKALNTGAARAAVRTDTRGFFRFTDVPAGTYEVIVSAPGFVRQIWNGIVVEGGAERVLNIVMQAGNPGQTVQLAAPVRAMGQGSAVGNGRIDAATVRNTPLNGRDWTQLATLQAGVTAVQTGNANGTGNADHGFGAAVSVSGARPDQNNYRLDGISINDYSNGAPGSVLGDNLGVDAVEQVSVLGNNYPAEYGRTSGGVINAVTRSGTNAFHGNLYEFLRNSALDARNYFDGRIPPFKRNQFGGSAGGALQKDRTFVFGDYEGLRQSLGVTTVDTVPSAAARRGELSTGAVTVDPAVARFLAAFYPLPNGPLLGAGDTGIFNFAAQQVTNENYFTIRVDRKFLDKDSLSGTYMRDASKTVQPDNFDELLSNIVSSRQVVALHEQHVFSPTLLNAARLGFNRAVGIVDGVSKVINPLMLDPSYGFEPGQRAGGVQAVPGVTDFLGAPTAQGPLPSSKSLYWNSFQGGDDISLTRGIHAIKFGGVVERMQDNELTYGTANGVFRFDSLSNFLTNHPLVFQGMRTRFVPDVGLRETLVGGYAQD
ncbi:MAG TPA: TonB-dependent receptor, partial [Terriglobales bacterium]|nr:TonB-dependent receptor [Terriglobales bacterium]